MYEDYIKNKIEDIVCSIVGIDKSDLYNGNGNIPSKRAVARNICLHVLHDKFAINYRKISELTGITQRSVIRCVKKARMFAVYDNEYISYMIRVQDIIKRGL